MNNFKDNVTSQLLKIVIKCVLSSNWFTEKKYQKKIIIIITTTRHLAPPWIILSHPEPTPIIPGLVFLCSVCLRLTLPSTSLG